MAQSPAHQFGQIVGDLLEAAIEPLLRMFAQEHGLFLDKRGRRPARPGVKVGWVDLFGNTHDLDFVLERDGAAEHFGSPVAFIETAWRRYTRHSRNKAQEIQGALLPLVTTHRNVAPFYGAILAGVFTSGAVTQLRSQGFAILYFPYDTVIEAFERVGLDARFDETTSDGEFAEKVRVWRSLSADRRAEAARTLVQLNAKAVQTFMQALERSVTRSIERVTVLPLHGTEFGWQSIDEAIRFIRDYDETIASHPITRYEVDIRYSNGDRIQGQFADKESTIEFLAQYRPPDLQPAW